MPQKQGHIEKLHQSPSVWDVTDLLLFPTSPRPCLLLHPFGLFLKGAENFELTERSHFSWHRFAGEREQGKGTEEQEH